MDPNSELKALNPSMKPKTAGIETTQRASFLLLLHESWAHLLLGVEPETTKPNVKRRKDGILLVARKGNAGDLSQSGVSANDKMG